MLSDFINKFEDLKTPFYFYDMELLRKTIDSVHLHASNHDYQIHYALKANANDRIIKLICKLGLGADCVGGNEIKAAVKNGFNSEDIVFAGVGKADWEIVEGLKNNIHCFNCESLEEIKVIDEIAGAANKIAPIAIRLNPNVDAKTHKYITTGLEENKFGIPWWMCIDVISDIEQFKNVNLIGLHFHIGSQITSLSAFKRLCIKVNEIQISLAERNINLPHLNLGGGLGIDYIDPDNSPIPDFEEFFALFNQFLEPIPGQKIHFELGRSIVGQSGSLISRVLYVKKGQKTEFAILDAGMTELLRPALYQSYHRIENLSSHEDRALYDVVGPICESSDSFGKAVELPKTKRNDLIAIRSTGGYGEVMASAYNLRDLPKAYYSDDL